MRSISLVLAAAMVLAVCPRGHAADDLDLELVLLADSSGSIDAAESRFQREGYAAAITHPDVLKAVRQGLTQRIALTYVEWGDDTSQDVVVPWTIIDGAETAAAFADALVKAPRRARGFNAIGSALARAQALIEGNAINGLRRVIDISADSANNWSGVPIGIARDAALAARITINGLAILCPKAGCGGRPVTYDLETAFRQQIVGGPGHFVVTADDTRSFAEAVRQKLILEIASEPLPGGRFSRLSEAPFGGQRSRKRGRPGEQHHSRAQYGN